MAWQATIHGKRPKRIPHRLWKILKERVKERSELYLEAVVDGKICVNPRHLPVEEVRRNEVKQL